MDSRLAFVLILCTSCKILTEAAVAQVTKPDCNLDDDYCYRSDICAYVFTLRKDGPCPGNVNAVTSLSALGEKLETQGASIKEALRKSDALRRGQAKTDQLVYKHDSLVKQQQTSLTNVEDRFDRLRDESQKRVFAIESEVGRLQRQDETQSQQLVDLVQKLAEQGEDISSLREIIAGPVQTQACEENWHMYNGHCYYIEEDIMSFARARAGCLSKGADLAIVNDQEESDFLKGILSEGNWAWIGLRDVTRNGNWQWIDGSMATFVDWVPGEPNNFEGNQENCVHIRMETNGQWNDWACWGEIKSICEKEAGEVPVEAKVDVRLARLETRPSQNEHRLALQEQQLEEQRELLEMQSRQLELQSQQLEAHQQKINELMASRPS